MCSIPKLSNRIEWACVTEETVYTCVKVTATPYEGNWEVLSGQLYMQHGAYEPVCACS